MSKESIELFEDVCSTDFLEFKFGGRGYQDQLYDSIAKTSRLAGVKVEVLTFPDSNQRIVWVQHDFAFLGGSLGCAEGEKITRAFEYAIENHLPICVQCRTGGARMQEGVSSLMQMAKVSVAVEALHQQGLPFIAVLNDPTYGGVSASYAMQADVKIALSNARIGFAGPAVILNTMCDADQARFDTECPPDFQSAQYLKDHGQIDTILDVSDKAPDAVQIEVETVVCSVARTLMTVDIPTQTKYSDAEVAASESDKSQAFNYTNSRKIDRPQCQDIIDQVFSDFFELCGDGRVGKDVCIRGGIATFHGRPCVVIANYKGHTPGAMQDSNYGMASPHGYRFALRLMKLAERFGMFVVTLVDTVGAWPTFECEGDGQSEAIATNLTGMAGLKVPIITLMVGEGGSGGALGIGMGNTIGMLSGGYFGVISPEGAASILGRYKDDAHKAKQFPLDCQELATAQCIYAYQLLEIGVVDNIIWESSNGETFDKFPILSKRIHNFICDSLITLDALDENGLIEHRYDKFRKLGQFAIKNETERAAAVSEANAKKSNKPRPVKPDTTPCKLISHLATEVVTSDSSRYRDMAPASCPLHAPEPEEVAKVNVPGGYTNAKKVLDSQGPEALAQWVKGQSKVLLTDTTMRDAHQSLVATRVRTQDLVKGAKVANELLKDAFSFECWGGATFDVCMRFLDECPWERLRELRAAAPDVCLQMLIRGANAVGYTSYPDNAVTEFVRLSAKNGMDVFRIFDCFNDIENMKVAITAVRESNKVAEVCLCYTGDLLTSNIYTPAYYRDCAKNAVDAGAHIIGIKDMSGLLRPLEAKPLLDAIREVTDLPIHFHTHSTSAGAIATAFEMAAQGCDIIDFCTASMADGTSQPSLNAFVAMMKGHPRDTGLEFMQLEPYDMYWARVREMYSPFESGMKSGSARVYEHQIPGGQYSNLYAQCKSMGLWDRWEEVLDSYRDVNALFGDIIKVTPSSKCVGDLSLYLVTIKMKAQDLLDPVKAASIDFPASVVGLMKGDLGFPHRGFPEHVEKMILKGGSRHATRQGLVLPPIDFAENIKSLCESTGLQLSEEDGMSSIMYPAVFSKFLDRRAQKGLLLKYLPTPVYFYAMKPNTDFDMTILPSQASELNIKDISALPKDKDGKVTVNIALKRVGPLKDRFREVVFSVSGNDQIAKVKDTTGVFVFEGPMVDASDSSQVGSPMPGSIEKILVKTGQKVEAGDTLMIIGAMKMEVKTSAPCSGTVSTISVTTGARVVEGALLCKVDP